MESGTGKVVAGVVIGAAVGMAIGASLGVLFAPDKGTATRKKISDKSDDYMADLKTTFGNFIDEVSQKFASAKEDATDMVDKGKDKLEDAKKQVKTGVHEVTNSYAKDGQRA